MYCSTFFFLRVFYVPPTVQHTSCTGVTAILRADIVSSSVRLVSTKQWCKTSVKWLTSTETPAGDPVRAEVFAQTSDAAERR